MSEREELALLQQQYTLPPQLQLPPPRDALDGSNFSTGVGLAISSLAALLGAFYLPSMFEEQRVALFGLACILGGLGYFVFKDLKRFQLEISGVPTIALMTECRHQVINESDVYDVRYTFLDHTGVIRYGHDRISALPTNPLAVLYSAERPENSRIYRERPAKKAIADVS